MIKVYQVRVLQPERQWLLLAGWVLISGALLGLPALWPEVSRGLIAALWVAMGIGVWWLLPRWVARPHQLTLTTNGFTLAASSGTKWVVEWPEIAAFRADFYGTRRQNQFQLRLIDGRQMRLVESWAYGSSDDLSVISRRIGQRLQQLRRTNPEYTMHREPGWLEKPAATMILWLMLATCLAATGQMIVQANLRPGALLGAYALTAGYYLMRRRARGQGAAWERDEQTAK